MPLDWAAMVEQEEDMGQERQQRGGQESQGLVTDTQYMPDGTKVVTEYIFGRDGEKIKVIKTFRTTTKRTKVFPAAAERRKRWKLFGKAKNNTPELTVIGETVTLELGKAQDLAEKKTDREIEKIIEGAAKQSASGRSTEGLFQASTKVATQGGAAAPDGLFRAAGRTSETVDGRPPRDDSCTVRVTNLSDEISEDDLRALFGRFGRVMRCYVGKDRQTQERKGFAFVTFQQKEQAEMAIEKLHRHPLNHVILNVTWAQPPNEKK
eukprot:TRINITY_DN55056_c0_g1_i1.p1 TRINITY_DN55056_c0_g1~~TRINITY_DN55056_c0_g1_i1.p1  ORF type:complete len:265 (+),score=103.69 TRINITY_DN55056_c0_g1_i1:110-904(+)